MVRVPNANDRGTRLIDRQGRLALRLRAFGSSGEEGKLTMNATEIPGMKLKDRIAIITGATSGIGEASARLFAEEGARVTVTGRDDARGRNVVAAIAAAGGTAIFVRADVRFPAIANAS